MDEEIIINSYTMIALHLRDSPAHLIAPSQQTGFGMPASFGGSSFHGRAPCASLTVTHNLRDLYRVRCYSLVNVVHINYINKQCQSVFVNKYKKSSYTNTPEPGPGSLYKRIL